MPASSTVLSWLPKCWIAKSLTGIGVRSIAALPTAITGSPAGPVRPATSWATPIAAAAASSPVRAPVMAAPRRPRICRAFAFIITREFGPGTISDWVGRANNRIPEGGDYHTNPRGAGLRITPQPC